MKRSKVAFPCKFPIDQSPLHLAEFCKAAKAADQEIQYTPGVFRR
jgi:hypothetical protein